MQDPVGDLASALRLVPCSISSTESGRVWLPRCTGIGRADPPVPSGDRVTYVLSRRGARALQDASVLCRERFHGFRAHWTFTLCPESRERLERGEFTLGSEMRRTLNRLQIWNDRHGKPPLRYQWVAENPGDRNPHVHLNVDFVSQRSAFLEYCRFVEDAWGLGTVHQEFIKDPRAAAAYLLKAVGYVSKGTQGGQGAIVGNRYGISACLRSRALPPLVIEDDGTARAVLHRLTDHARETGAIVPIGRGAFATPYGIGAHYWSGLESEDLAHYLLRGGEWVEDPVGMRSDV